MIWVKALYLFFVRKNGDINTHQIECLDTLICMKKKWNIIKLIWILSGVIKVSKYIWLCIFVNRRTLFLFVQNWFYVYDNDIQGRIYLYRKFHDPRLGVLVLKLGYISHREMLYFPKNPRLFSRSLLLQTKWIEKWQANGIKNSFLINWLKSVLRRIITISAI